MNSPVPPPPERTGDRVSLLRLAAWIGIAVVIVAGIVFYFRHGAEVSPLLDSVRTP